MEATFDHETPTAKLQNIATKLLDDRDFFQAELALQELERRQGRFAFMNFNDNIRSHISQAMSFFTADHGDERMVFIRGAFAYRARQYELGQGLLRQAIAASPGNNRARLYLAYCLFSLNQQSSFPDVLGPVLATERIDWQIYDLALELLCEFYIGGRKAELVREICERSIQDVGERAPALVHMGTSGILLDDERSAAWFRSAAAAPGYLLSWSRGIQTVLEENVWKAGLSLLEDRLNQLPKLQFLGDDKPGASNYFVLVVTADSNYFRRYFEAFIEGVWLSNNAITIHFHFMNPQDGDLARLSGVIEKWKGRLTINVSIERAPFAVRTYYACARFLRLRELLRRYECPLLVSDIDIVLRSDIRPLFGDVSCSVALKVTRSDGRPWRRVDAKLFVIKPTSDGFEFAADIASYLLECFGTPIRDSNELWYCDQNAMFWVMDWWLRAGRKQMFFDISTVDKHILGGGRSVNPRSVSIDLPAEMRRAVYGLRIQKKPESWNQYVPEEQAEASLYLIEAMRILSSMQRKDEAVQAGLRAHEMMACGEDDVFTLLGLLLSTRQYSEAEEISRSLEERGCNRAGKLKEIQAEIFDGLGRSDDAIRLAVEASRINPKASHPLSLAGYYYLKATQYEQAKEFLERSYSIAPQAVTCSRLSLCFEKLGDLDKAAVFSRKAVELDGSNENRLSEAARLALRTGNVDIAVYYLSSLVSISRKGTNLARLANAYQRGGDLVSAQQAMEQAVAATPGNADYLLDLGEICVSLEEQSRAIEVLAEAATAGANSAAILLRVSKAFERMGNIPYALQYCHSAHAIDGTSPEVLNQIKRLGAIAHPAA